MTGGTVTPVRRGHPGGGVGALMRRRVAPSTGIALLLAGGALCVRVMAAILLDGTPGLVWLYTAAACVLAGVALVLVALPKFVASHGDGASAPPGG